MPHESLLTEHTVGTQRDDAQDYSSVNIAAAHNNQPSTAQRREKGLGDLDCGGWIYPISIPKQEVRVAVAVLVQVNSGIVRTGNLRLIDGAVLDPMNMETAHSSRRIDPPRAPVSELRLYSGSEPRACRLAKPHRWPLTIEEGTPLRLSRTRCQELQQLRTGGLGFRCCRARRGSSKRNPIDRARRNVAHHYDLSDQLYRPLSTRTASIPAPTSRAADDSLEKAQENKKRHIASKLLLDRPAPQDTRHSAPAGAGSAFIWLKRQVPTSPASL